MPKLLPCIDAGGGGSIFCELMVPPLPAAPPHVRARGPPCMTWCGGTGVEGYERYPLGAAPFVVVP